MKTNLKKLIYSVSWGDVRYSVERRDRLPTDYIPVPSVNSFQFQPFDEEWFVSIGTSFFMSDLVRQKTKRLPVPCFSFFKN